MYERRIITDTGINNIPLIGKYRYDKAGDSLKPHLHRDIMEVVYCHSGTQLYEVNKRQYRIKGGEIFITFPNELHSTDQKPEEKGIIYWVQIYIHPEKNKLLQLPEDESVLLISKLLNIKTRRFKADRRIHKIFEEMLLANELHVDAEKRIRIKQLILQLIIILIDAPKGKNTGLTDDKISVISSFIRDNLTQNLNISRLASEVHLSESRFKSWFKQAYGMPTMEYLQRQKIKRAIELWEKTPEKSATDIAYYLNFSSPQHFSTLFRKYVGKTPMSFRKDLKINPPE
jgi:AraC-like DNA-binding protein